MKIHGFFFQTILLFFLHQAIVSSNCKEDPAVFYFVFIRALSCAKKLLAKKIWEEEKFGDCNFAKSQAFSQL